MKKEAKHERVRRSSMLSFVDFLADNKYLSAVLLVSTQALCLAGMSPRDELLIWCSGYYDLLSHRYPSPNPFSTSCPLEGTVSFSSIVLSQFVVIYSVMQYLCLISNSPARREALEGRDHTSLFTDSSSPGTVT